MADRFEELKVFVAVAEAGGINAAAARLGLAKSAVSRRIAALEERIGVDLLSRETRRFALTPAGLAHHARAKALLADLDELDRSAGDAARTRPLTVSAPFELAVHVVAPALAALSVRHPDATFSLVVDDALADIQFAVAAASGRRKVDGEVGRASLGIYASPDGKGSGSGADRRSIEVSSPPAWLRWSVAPSTTVAPVTVATLDMALAAAIGGAGVTTLPDFIAAEAVQGGRLVLLQDQPAGPVVTITATVATGVEANGLLAEVAARLRRA